jgi:Lon protease-like protein
MASQPIRLPLFSVPCVVFPDEAIPFHIFEARYRRMVEDILAPEAGDKVARFGVTCVDGEMVFQIGCAVVIERVLEEYPDGRFDILTRGVMRYRILDIDRSGPYPIATVEYFDDSTPPESMLVGRAVALHIKLTELSRGHPTPPDFSPDQRVSFALAHNAGLDLTQRQSLLEMRSEDDRLAYLVEYYQRIIPEIQKRRDIQERIQANGHIRILRSADYEDEN